MSLQTDNKSSSQNDEEELRKCLKPNPTDDHILKAIKDTYQTSAVSIVKRLESYDDCNYLVLINNKKYLAKVYNGVESAVYIQATGTDNDNLSFIHLHSYIFQHLAQPQFNVTTSSPFPIPGKVSPPYVSVHTLPVTSQGHSPAKLVLQVLTWVEGCTMSSSPILPIETLADAGRYLGKVCIALDDLNSSNANAKKASDRYHAWDGRHTLDLKKFVNCIENEQRRNLVLSVLDAFKTNLVESGDIPSFRTGILMADFNDANIILDQDKNVAGVIDFGDSTYSWRVLDISVAMAYAMMSSYGKINRAISAAAAILRGFHSIYPLTIIERKHLRLLIAARLSCSATLGAYSYKQNPQNKYLLLHSEPAWKTLELIWGSGANHDFIHAINCTFDRACDYCTICENNNFIHCTDIGFPDPEIQDVFKLVRSEYSTCTNGVNSEKSAQKRARIEDNSNDVITFVTGNKKKLEEVKRILAVDSSNDLPFLISNRKIDLPELQGDPLEIAKEKCAIAAKEVNGAVITEDTSLCFTALNDMPGPYIKWFLEKCGHNGLNNMIAFSDDKSGYAQTVVGFCPGPGQDVVVFDGRTKGIIVPARGPLDFGWDPIFQPYEGEGKTYAEMEKSEKDAISHRSRAFEKLRKYLVEQASNIQTKISSS